MPSLSIILGLTIALSWGTADYLSRYQSERVGHYNTVVYMLLTNLVILLLVFLVIRPPVAISLVPLAVMVAAGVLNFFAFVFLYRAFHTGVVSAVAPVAYTYPVVTTILSIFLLGSVLLLPEAAAISCVILGVILLSTRFSELKSYFNGSGPPTVVKGVEWAVVSSITFGVLYVAVGYATPSLGYFLPVFVIRAVGSLVGFAAAPAFKVRVRPTRASFSTIVISMAALETVGLLAFNYGLSLGPNTIPIIASLSGMGGAVAATYAITLLRERLEWNQIMGAALVIAGVFALLYFVG